MKNPRSLSGVTWDCSGCGACCRSSYRLGPVEPSIIEGLRALDVEAHWPPAAEGWVDPMRGPDGEVSYFLRTVNGACVFLQEDNRCAIHARWGAEAKPGFCREFPFHVVADPSGLTAVVRSDCVGFHHSFEGGTPVERQADAVIALPRSVPMRTFAPERVTLFPGVEVTLQDWWPIEEELLRRAEAADGAEAAFSAVREGLYAAAGRTPPAPNPLKARLAEEAVLRAAQMLLGRAVEQPEGGSADQRQAAEAGLATVQRALEGLEQPVPPPAEDLSRYVQVLLRTELLARLWETSGAVGVGLGRFHLHDRLARRLVGEGPVSAQDWSAHFVPFKRLTGIPAMQWVYGKAAPAFLDLFRLSA